MNKKEILEENTRNLSATELKVLEAFTSYAASYGSVYPSQEKIAKRVGISRGHCNRIIKKLKSKGFLVVTYRHRNTCVYELAKTLFIDGIKHILMKSVPSLKYMPIFLSISMLYSNYVTPVNLTVLKGITETVINRRRNMEPFIPKRVREIITLNLTLSGMVKLSGMPSEAIDYAEKQMQFSKNINDPYGWFFKNCMDYCKREGLVIDWVLVDSLKKQLRIEETEERTVTERIHREKYLKKNHPEKAFNDSQIPSKHPVEGKKEVVTPRSAVTPPDVIESNRRKKEREEMSEFAKKEDKVFRDGVVEIKLGCGSKEEKHLMQHHLMGLTTVDPIAIKMIACEPSSCLFLVSKEPSVDVEDDKPTTQTPEATRTVFPETSSGMKTIQSIMFGQNGAMIKRYTDGTTSG